MNFKQIISFSPRKVVELLNENKNGGDFEAKIDSVETNTIVDQGVKTLRFITGLEIMSEIRRKSAQREYAYASGLHDAMNPTSFEVAEPIPCASDVCDCEYVGDVDIVSANDVGIDDAFFTYVGKNNIEIITYKRENMRAVVFCNARIYGVDYPIKLTFPLNIVFENIYCISCGTRIGWCTEIGGRGFKTTPDEFIEGLFTEQINKILETKI